MKLSKRISDWYLGTNNTVEKEVPKEGTRRIGYMLCNHTTKLLVVNLLFLVCCIPIITIPAAICALNRYVGKMYREGYGFEYSDFRQEFKQEVEKSLPIGSLLFILGFYGIYLLSMALQFPEGVQGIVIQTVGIFCLLLTSLLGAYSFLLLSMLQLTMRQALKNAAILVLCEWKADILLILLEVTTWGVVLALFPYSIVFPLVGAFSIRHLVIVGILNSVIEKRILIPYKRKCLSK